ncbi:MAG TPA: S41 family peptidase [Flavisolibacter sp.]|nr:S41 family peptidase [Flavisolibacter sp.]
MKKIVTLFTILVLGFNSWAQSKQQVEHLSALAQVWGFLKYYHPAASKGMPDWDAELVKMIPKVKAVRSQKEWELLMATWYQSLPEARMAAIKSQPKGDSVIRVFNEHDIKQLPVSKSLQQQFLKLYQYHLPDSSKYFTNTYKTYKLDYVRHIEDSYADQPYPSEELRLLSLFRYWNVINYFYPHKALITNDWRQVLTQYIPVFLQATDSMAYRTVVHQLTREIHDSHSFFSHKEWNKRFQYTPPFTIYYLNGKYVIGESKYDSLMKLFDLRLGDEIVAIEGKTVKQCETELLALFDGTNTLSKYRNVAAYLLAGADSTMNVRFKRGQQLLEKEIGRYAASFLFQLRVRKQQSLWKQVEPGIWYVDFCSIRNPDTLQKLFHDIKDAKSVIWDMRDYPYFPVTQQMGRGFFPVKTYLEDNYNASADFPGVFTKQAYFFEPHVEDTTPVYKGRLIVLVGEHTQSLSESIAASLRSRENTIVMGRQTAGTTGNITFFDLPGNIQVSYTAVAVHGSSNSFRQKQGVKIDKPITITVEKLQRSPDYALEEAVREAKR